MARMAISAVLAVAVVVFILAVDCRAASYACQDTWFGDDSNWTLNDTLLWDERKNEEGISVYTRGSLISDFVLFKATSVFPATSYDALYDLLWTRNVERNGEWSKSFVGGKYVVRMGDNADILYMQYSAFWPVDGRDFCYIRCKKDFPGGTQMVFRSIDDAALCPQQKGYVRGVMIDCAERIERLADGSGIRVTYILQTDTRGLLPKGVSNYANIDVMFKEFQNLHLLTK
eukprot:Opistho-2@68485